MYRKCYPHIQKGKQYRNGQKLWLKMQKDQEQCKKIIIELKEELQSFIYFWYKIWAKALLQPKSKLKSAVATQSMDITDPEIASVLPSVLLCLNGFYYHANFKLINSLKFT